MKLVIEAFNKEHAIDLINNNADIVVLSNNKYATRINYSFSDNEILEFAKNKKNSEIWVKVNAIFFEQNLNDLENYLKWLSNINIDRIIFQDLAVAQIIKENNLNIKLHYCPETIVTNYGQFDFYNYVGFNSVFLARELSFNELKEISENKKNIEIEIQGHGYSFIMHSRWKMINNFIDYYNLDKQEINKDYLLVKEELRKYNDIIFEDEHGTHMLTGYILYTIDIIDKLKSLNIDYLRLDFIKTNEQYAKAISNLYINTIKNNFDNDKKELFNNLNKHFVITHGFLGGINEILGLKKNEEQHE